MATPDTPGKKFMDVSKPSMRKPDDTARPLIVGHKNIIVQDPMVAGTKTAPEIIKPSEPISTKGKDVERSEVKAEEPEAAKVTAAEETLAPQETAEEPEEERAEEPADTPTETKETSGVETPEVETPTEPTDNKAQPVNAENEKIAKLISSREYYLPIKKSRHASSGHSNKAAIVILLLIIALATGYVMIDAQIVKNSIKLPYHIFKNISLPE